MLTGNREYAKSPSIREFEPTFSEVNSAAFSNTWLNNPEVLASDYYDFNEAQDVGEKSLSKEQAEARASEEGIVIKNIPEEGLTEEGYKVLSSRQQKLQDNAAILSDADAGFFRQAIPSFIAGMASPTNIAVDIAAGAILGKAFKIGKMASEASKLSRVMRNAKLGALEGGIGAAAIEPVVHHLANELGDDYDIYDSFENIAFGSVLGGGIRMGAGALGDAYAKYKNAGKAPDTPFNKQGLPEEVLDNVEPQGRNAKSFEAAPRKTQFEYQDLAFKQALNDSDIDLSSIRNKEVAQAYVELDQIDQKIDRIKNDQTLTDTQISKTVEALEARRNRVLTQLDDPRIELKAQEAQPLFRDKDIKNIKKKKRVERPEIVEARINDQIQQGWDVFYNKDGKPVPVLRAKNNQILLADGSKVNMADAVTRIGDTDKFTINRRSEPLTPRDFSEPENKVPPKKDSRYVEPATLTKVAEDKVKYIDTKISDDLAETVLLAEEKFKAFAEREGIDMADVLEEANLGIIQAEKLEGLLDRYINCR